MKIQVDGDIIEVDSVVVLDTDPRMEIHTECGKLFVVGDGPMAPASFSGENICVNYCRYPYEVTLRRTVLGVDRKLLKIE